MFNSGSYQFENLKIKFIDNYIIGTTKRKL
ncbi:hypothetical protein C7955_107157 [Eubacterium limosum]|nr:hypothetical protein C7955_107157 [Eubacterium limosum]